MSTFKNYVPATVNSIVNDEKTDLPITKEFEGVILFLDLTGFTSMSQILNSNPKELSNNINSYLQNIN